jgi:hypothetical protein
MTAEHFSIPEEILGLNTNSKEFFVPQVTRIMEKAPLEWAFGLPEGFLRDRISQMIATHVALSFDASFLAFISFTSLTHNIVALSDLFVSTSDNKYLSGMTLTALSS